MRLPRSPVMGKPARFTISPRLLDREREIVPETKTVTIFSRPPFYAVLLSSLSRLPYRNAFITWVFAQGLGLAVCWAWAFRRFGDHAATYTCLYLPLMVAIALGQDAVFPLLVVIGAYVLARRNRVFLGGALLGLGLFKFHLFVLWPMMALAQRRWKLFFGFTITALAELAISLHFAGVGGLSNYVRLLSDWNATALHPAPGKVISLWGTLASVGVSSPLMAAIAALPVAAFLMFKIRNATLDHLFVVAIAGSLAIVPARLCL